MLALFFVGIVPSLPRLTSFLVPANSPFAPSDNIPPQPPSISAPPPATVDKTLTVAGFSEDHSTIVLLVDSQEVARTKADSQGEFEFKFALTEGENMFSLYALDDAGNFSATTRSYTVVQDSQPPDISIESLDDGQEIIGRNNQRVTVAGQTEPKARVLVNGRLVLADEQGRFSTTLLLSEGDNTIAVKAEDRAGNSTETEFKVKFRF